MVLTGWMTPCVFWLAVTSQHAPPEEKARMAFSSCPKNPVCEPDSPMGSIVPGSVGRVKGGASSGTRPCFHPSPPGDRTGCSVLGHRAGGKVHRKILEAHSEPHVTISDEHHADPLLCFNLLHFLFTLAE